MSKCRCCDCANIHNCGHAKRYAIDGTETSFKKAMTMLDKCDDYKPSQAFSELYGGQDGEIALSVLKEKYRKIKLRNDEKDRLAL